MRDKRWVTKRQCIEQRTYCDQSLLPPVQHRHRSDLRWEYSVVARGSESTQRKHVTRLSRTWEEIANEAKDPCQAVDNGTRWRESDDSNTTATLTLSIQRWTQTDGIHDGADACQPADPIAWRRGSRAPQTQTTRHWRCDNDNDEDKQTLMNTHVLTLLLRCLALTSPRTRHLPRLYNSYKIFSIHNIVNPLHPHPSLFIHTMHNVHLLQ